MLFVDLHKAHVCYIGLNCISSRELQTTLKV